MITVAEIVAIGIVLPLVAILVVGLRLYLRHTRSKGIVLNDYLIIASLACFVSTSGVILAGTFAGGLGRASPPPQLTADGLNAVFNNEIRYTRHLVWSGYITSIFTIGLAKLSVVFFYRSIFVGRLFNILSIGLVAMVLLWFLFTLVFLVFQCKSYPSAIWAENAAYDYLHCYSAFSIIIPTASLDVATDLFILVLPIYWVWKLQMSVKKRISVLGVFLFGAFTMATSVLRLSEFGIAYPTRAKTSNQFAYLTTVLYWYDLESGMSIIAACLPTLGPILFPRRDNRAETRVGNEQSGRKSSFTRFGSVGTHCAAVTADHASAVHKTSSSGDFVMQGITSMNNSSIHSSSEQLRPPTNDIVVTTSFDIESRRPSQTSWLKDVTSL